MSFDTAIFKGMTEGPFGLPMTDEQAFEVDALVKSLPSGEEFGYQKAHYVTKMSNEVLEGERADISIVSTDSFDLDREVVMPGGIDLSQFKKNPVVTFNHQWNMLPVGSAKSPGWIKYDKSLNALKAKTYYATKPDDWDGEWLPDAVYHMVKIGMLPGKSIGFVGIEGGPPKPDEIKARPELAECRWMFRKTLLLEYAVASVQSCPDALVQSKGIVTPEICKQLGLTMPDIEATKEIPQLPADFADAIASMKSELLEKYETLTKQFSGLRTLVVDIGEHAVKSATVPDEDVIPKPTVHKTVDSDAEKRERERKAAALFVERQRLYESGKVC